MLIGNKRVWIPIFSSALLQPRTVLPAKFIEISQAIPPTSDRVEDFADKHRYTHWDSE